MRVVLLLAAASLAACTATTTTAPISGSIPGASTVCAQLSLDRLDVAFKAYDAAIDAINLLLDAKVITPGSAKANAIANANDRVLQGLTAAENARKVCNATSYSAALDAAKSALGDLRAAIGSK